MITSVVMAATLLLSNKVNDARTAMCALIESRALPLQPNEAGYAAAVARIAWEVAEAMADERAARTEHKGK